MGNSTNAGAFDGSGALTSAYGKAVTRGQHTRVIHYSDTVWTQAQQMESHFADLCSSMELSKNMTEVVRVKLRKLVKKSKAIEPTPVQSTVFDRRTLITETYHTAVEASIDDIIEGNTDFFGETDRMNAYAVARTVDEVILSGIPSAARIEISEVKQSDYSKLAASGDELTTLATGAGHLVRLRDIAWVLKDTVQTTANPPVQVESDLFGLDAFEKVFRVLRSKSVPLKGLVFALPPIGFEQLRVDPKFADAENIFTNRGVGNVSRPANAPFQYKNVWIQEIDPMSSPELGPATVITKEKEGDTVTLLCKKYSTVRRKGKKAMQSGVIKATSAGYMPQAGTGTTGAAAVHNAQFGAGSIEASDYQLIEAREDEIGYIYIKDALKFGRRPEAGLNERYVAHEKSMARGAYLSVRLGAALLDEDFAMIVPLFGKQGT